MKGLRLLVADDHDVIRRGVKTILEAQRGWKVIGEAANADEAVECAKRLRPDVVVMDVSMNGTSGLAAAREITRTCPGTEVVILTMHESGETVREAMAAGARGYVSKSDAETDIVAAVRSVSRQQPFFSRRGAEIVRESYRSPGASLAAKPARPLTGRQLEVVRLLAEGKSNKEVAVALGISVKTAERHRANVMERLECETMSHLVRWAVRHGIVAG